MAVIIHRSNLKKEKQNVISGENIGELLTECRFSYFTSQGGDILLETISSNVTEDVITLEFQCSDGTLVTQLIDFKNVNIYPGIDVT